MKRGELLLPPLLREIKSLHGFKSKSTNFLVVFQSELDSFILTVVERVVQRTKVRFIFMVDLRS